MASSPISTSEPPPCLDTCPRNCLGHPSMSTCITTTSKFLPALTGRQFAKGISFRSTWRQFVCARSGGPTYNGPIKHLLLLQSSDGWTRIPRLSPFDVAGWRYGARHNERRQSVDISMNLENFMESGILSQKIRGHPELKKNSHINCNFCNFRSLLARLSYINFIRTKSHDIRDKQ